MHIAYVTETYPPEVNGVALTVARVVEGLRQRQHCVHLIRPRQHAADAVTRTYGDDFLVRGLPIPRYPSLRMGVPSKRKLLRLWAEHRPDVVHLATEGPLGWSALRAALELRLPVCSDFRTNFHGYARHYGAAWLQRPLLAYLRSFHNRTHRTMVPTEALRRDLQAHGFDNLLVVSHGVDVRQFSPQRRSHDLRARWGANAGDPVVLSVGRLAPEKNLQLVLDTFAAIRCEQPRARLVLVGDGPLREELAANCADAVFAGQRLGEDLAQHYASADLFLFPSLTETFGNVTAEAMASGLPVVAFDYAAAAQLIRNDDTGARIPLGDNSAFLCAARRLAIDPLVRQAMGRRARQAVGDFDWARVIVRLENVLRQSCVASSPTEALLEAAASGP